MEKKEFVTEMGKYIASKAQGVRQKKLNQYGLSNTLKLDLRREEDIALYNEIYQKFKHSNLNQIVRTKCGAIAQTRANRRGVWDYKEVQVGGTITAIIEGYTFCVTIDMGGDDDETKMRGRTAFRLFKEKCEEQGINLKDYKIDNGEEVKKTIPSPKISMFNHMIKDDEGLTNCHHIDFHNSYPAGLCNTHPEFRPVIEPLYLTRKTSPQNKAILNLTIGFMQSDIVRYAYSHLSKDAIIDNNNRIDDLAARIEASGRKILGFNTDGIWYQGEIFHGEGEGMLLGDWSNDHINCIFRSKSNGAYEYIEDGQYHVVLRGRTNYDKVKPRSEWEWGDIYQKGIKVIVYKWDDAIGIVKVEEEV